eukprot:TRINITY_DN21024_c6_g1_i1.p1 TRINITY_DN21024_c6_g1~~TRINITY_DN21024_c6_g1_i1.p1  ORF type:complete len:249 (+),score=86.68 TRINITY_DN21024_c6_g1_i1:62-748(+)
MQTMNRRLLKGAALSAQSRTSVLAQLKNLKRRDKISTSFEVEESTDDVTVSSSEPWMYRTLDEERLGASRAIELATAHKLEFQRLYIPDGKLPGHDDHIKLGQSPEIPFDYDGTFHYEDSTKYTHEARKLMQREDFWAKDSMRMQLDGTFDPKSRADLSAKLKADVPVPDLNWDTQFPMWNPRNSSPPKPKKGRMMYMYSLAKGAAYMFKKGQKNIYSGRGVSYRGMA